MFQHSLKENAIFNNQMYIYIYETAYSKKNILWQPLWIFSEKFGFLKPRCRREEEEESCCINWRFDGFTAAASPILLLTPLQLQLLSNFSSAHCGYYSYKYEDMHLRRRFKKREKKTNVSFALTHTYIPLVKTNIFPFFSFSKNLHFSLFFTFGLHLPT